MAEQFLEGVQVRAGVQQMGGEGVPQTVAARWLGEASGSDHPTGFARIHSTSPSGRESLTTASWWRSETSTPEPSGSGETALAWA